MFEWLVLCRLPSPVRQSASQKQWQNAAMKGSLLPPFTYYLGKTMNPFNLDVLNTITENKKVELENEGCITIHTSQSGKIELTAELEDDFTVFQISNETGCICTTIDPAVACLVYQYSDFRESCINPKTLKYSFCSYGV